MVGMRIALQYRSSKRIDVGFRREAVILRIQRSARDDAVVFALSGRIRAEEVAELQTLFEAEKQNNIVLDLKEVKLVDRVAVEFLACWEAHGAQLENCPAYIREWISAETVPNASCQR